MADLDASSDELRRALLWAPWRLAYVSSEQPPPAGCFLCAAAQPADQRAHLVAWRRTRCIVVLNRYPYNNGHLLVAPINHKGGLGELDADETLELQDTLRDVMSSLERIMRPDGFNVGLNLGKVAGAGLPGHLHWHVVPRWHGDVNFMPTVASVKVIPQALEALYDLLVQDLGAVHPSASRSAPKDYGHDAN